MAQSVKKMLQQYDITFPNLLLQHYYILIEISML